MVAVETTAEHAVHQESTEPTGRKWACLRWVAELFALVFLGLVAVLQGYDALVQWHGPASSLTNELYIPAAAMAAGRGFVNIIPESVPGFRAFLDFQQPSIDPELIRSAGREQPLHSYQEYHRYLVTAVGWVWCLFGVSWESIKILIVLLFLLSLWAVYGVSRLAMGVAAAMVVALGFAFTGTVAVALPLLRDFSKAPFILGTILLLGWVVRRPRGGRWVAVFAFLAGLLLGVGVGFRRDAMVVMPFAVLVFLLAPVAANRIARRCAVRLAAVAVLGAAFCLSGWPILRSFYNYGTLAAHDTIMGFASNADREMSLEPASYEKLYLLDDLYCSMLAYDAGRRGVTGDADAYRQHYTEPTYDDVLKKRYVMAVAMQFPADMIVRGYAAALRILGGIWGAGFAPDPPPAGRFSPRVFFYDHAGLLYRAVPYGAWFALVALVCVSAVNWRLATAMLAFVLFFGGYTSGQFAFRHAFHLEFAPFFFGALLADQSVRHMARLVRGRCWGKVKSIPFSAAGRGALRSAAWLMCMLALLHVPVRAAAALQRAHVNKMTEQVRQAEKEPVGHRESPWDDRVLLTPEVSDDCANCQNDGLLVDFRTTVYTAVFDAGPETPDVQVCYESSEFSHPARLAMGPGPACGVTYCFPVFETTTCTGWIRFAGLAVPRDQAVRFKGFQRVRHPEALGLLVNLTLPDDPQRMLFRQYARWPWHGSPPATFGSDGNKGEVFQMEAKARGAAAAGNWADALAAWEALAARRPHVRVVALGRVEALDRLERPAEALDRLVELLAAHPAEGLAVRLADDCLTRLRGPEGKAAAWRALSERLPADPCVLRMVAPAAATAPAAQ